MNLYFGTIVLIAGLYDKENNGNFSQIYFNWNLEVQENKNFRWQKKLQNDKFGLKFYIHIIKSDQVLLQ